MIRYLWVTLATVIKSVTIHGNVMLITRLLINLFVYISTFISVYLYRKEKDIYDALLS